MFFNKLYKKIGKIQKRVRLVISSFILTWLMLIATFFSFDKYLYFIVIFIFFGVLLTYFSIIDLNRKTGLLSRSVNKVKTGWLMLFLMPVYMSISFYFFYFLFPVRWLTRFPFIIIYAISIYALLLVSNILNIGVEKSFQLFRAAFSVNFFYQTLVLFLITNVLFSMKSNFFLNGLGVFFLSFPLAVQYLWSIDPQVNIEKELIKYGLIASLFIGELSIVFSFVPINGAILSLFITSSYYSLLGVIFNYIEKKLFKETIKEYLVVLFFVFLVVFLSIRFS